MIQRKTSFFLNVNNESNKNSLLVSLLMRFFWGYLLPFAIILWDLPCRSASAAVNRITVLPSNYRKQPNKIDHIYDVPKIGFAPESIKISSCDHQKRPIKQK